ncbi:uncharacterized protein B0I36DRAFT_86194 [Microdochium trichocladiopsis]|uniref:Uncharacterized protein n=1 Tax=Microdochium trichocladiopsis TaxID=1682393 RepID=A0A9P9BWD4_9PEZI|nr:uncharacterized protein B0I36DRAFT_86194 [Microdochium trichocladiopsis]KAH7034966.1 hypothetical protein B0I36DRAFT_86194 [Microdochium trichocladiopsis]
MTRLCGSEPQTAGRTRKRWMRSRCTEWVVMFRPASGLRLWSMVVLGCACLPCRGSCCAADLILPTPGCCPILLPVACLYISHDAFHFLPPRFVLVAQNTALGSPFPAPQFLVCFSQRAAHDTSLPRRGRFCCFFLYRPVDRDSMATITRPARAPAPAAEAARAS